MSCHCLQKPFHCAAGEFVGASFLCQPAEMCSNFPRKSVCLLLLPLMVHLAASWRVNNKQWFMFWWKCSTNILCGPNFLAKESSRGADFIFKDITRLNWQFAKCSILNQRDVLMSYSLSSWDWLITLPKKDVPRPSGFALSWGFILLILHFHCLIFVWTFILMWIGTIVC